jgi:hypothetical protein
VECEDFNVSALLREREREREGQFSTCKYPVTMPVGGDNIHCECPDCCYPSDNAYLSDCVELKGMKIVRSGVTAKLFDMIIYIYIYI